jgi:hypothetical protein
MHDYRSVGPDGRLCCDIYDVLFVLTERRISLGQPLGVHTTGAASTMLSDSDHANRPNPSAGHACKTMADR